MPRCYMVKKGSSHRHDAAPLCSPIEASVAPPCYSPALAELRSAEYAVLRGVGGEADVAGEGGVGGAAGVMAGRSAADTEAAHELLSLAQSLPPLPPAAVVTVLDSAPLLYTYTIQPTNIYILADDAPPDSIYHAVQSMAPLETVNFDQINYVYSEQESEPVVEIIDQTDYIERTSECAERSPDFIERPRNHFIERTSNYAERSSEYMEVEPQSHREQEVDVEVVQELELELEIEIEHVEEPKRGAETQREVDFRPDRKSVSEAKPIREVKPAREAKYKRDTDHDRDVERDAERDAEVEADSEHDPDVETTPNSKDKQAKYDCKECGKRYATSSNLSRHKQTHRSLDSQSARRCAECGKAYVSMPALAMHVLTHRMGHVCGVCGKQFSRPWLLRGHLRSHTGEKPYKCQSCGKSFADRSNLRAHLQTHSSDKKYECTRCGKTFALKSYLHKHQESACARDEDD